MSQEQKSMKINTDKDGKVGVEFSSSLTLTEALQLYFTGGLAILKSYTPRDNSVEDEEAKGEIYDLFNVGASHVLDVYAPEIALRPDLTTEAVFDAELTLLSKKYGVPKNVVKQYAAKMRKDISQNTGAVGGH